MADMMQKRQTSAMERIAAALEYFVTVHKADHEPASESEPEPESEENDGEGA